MDVAYNQHSHHSKRNSRSSLNLNHLSLAPLTSKLPLNDADELPESVSHPCSSHRRSISYLEGKSAPTTPGILSRSSSRVSLRRPIFGGLTKSKSHTNVRLAPPKFPARRHVPDEDELDLSSLTAADRNDSDWLLRAGALIASETRESKGQAWLVSRASSTSLTGQLDEDEEALERQLARERDSRLNSRRGSAAAADADDEFSPVTTRMSFGGGSRSVSRYGSYANSRAQSRRGSKANLFTPLAMTEKERESYFGEEEQEFVTEPDFVDVEEDVYERDQAEDEVIVKRLAQKGTSGLGVWVEKLMGWSLFAVEEDSEETDGETNEDKTETDASDVPSRNTYSAQDTFDESADTLRDEKLPLPGPDKGGWQDAAWLLSVATKVLL